MSVVAVTVFRAAWLWEFMSILLVSCHHDIIENVGGEGDLMFLTVIVEVMHFQ